MKDGVKLAADAHLPEDFAANDQVAALLYQTRYWRSYRSRAAGMGNSLWSQFVGRLDDNNLEVRSVRPVDTDWSGAMLSEAVAQHSENLDVYKAFSPITFRDTSAGDSGLSFYVASSLYWREKIEKSGVVMFVMASWLDAGVADGALLRYNNYSNPQKLWSLQYFGGLL
jgi:hypothetical protein